MLSSFQTPFRYDHLSTRIMNRGKLLRSGMQSYQSILPSIEAFLSWAAEQDRVLDGIDREGEAVRAKPGRPRDEPLPKEIVKKAKVSGVL